jgi:hypothetical protein
VVATGLAGPSGTRILYAVRVADKRLPGTRFGVMLGHRAGGRLVDDVLANEFQGSDRSPGFHAVSDAMSTSRGDVGVLATTPARWPG